MVGCFADVNNNLKTITTMKRFMLLVVALSISTIAMAQKSDTYFSLSGVVKSGSARLTDSKDAFAFSDIDLVYGIHFNDKWALTIPITGSTAMNTKVKTYSDMFYLGLGGEYKFYKRSVSEASVVANIQSTVGKNDWKGAMTYDICLKDTFENVQIAVGLRYFDAYKSVVPDRLCLYLSFGFTLDLR